MLIAILTASLVIGTYKIGKIAAEESFAKSDFPIDSTKR